MCKLPAEPIYRQDAIYSRTDHLLGLVRDGLVDLLERLLNGEQVVLSRNSWLYSVRP
jgi:hypothetical protein